MAWIVTMTVIGNQESWACTPVPSVTTTMAKLAGMVASTAQTGSVLTSNFIR